MVWREGVGVPLPPGDGEDRAPAGDLDSRGYPEETPSPVTLGERIPFTPQSPMSDKTHCVKERPTA